MLSSIVTDQSTANRLHVFTGSIQQLHWKVKLETEYAQVPINASSGQKAFVSVLKKAENLLFLIQDQTTSEKSRRSEAAYWWVGSFFKNDLATAKT